MALRDIKRRIRSVSNTAKITKAMEVVSATKMRKSQAMALSGRPYAIAAMDILKNVSERSPIRPSLLASREIKATLLVVITSDRGLAGAFNANVLRMAERWMAEHRGESTRIVTVGKKAARYFATRNIELAQTFSDYGDYVSRRETEPLAELLIWGFLKNDWDRVVVFYTNFRTTLRQETRAIEVLPIHVEKIRETIQAITPEHGRFANDSGTSEKFNYSYEYALEPSPEAVLERLIPILFKIQMHHIVLESNASEHSARMVAMKNASENANELIGELTISYNKARQAGITRELTEITAGKEAIDQS